MNVPGNDTAKSSEEQADWTIMLYVAADGDVANFAIESLKQLNHSAGRAGPPTDSRKVVVAVQFALDAPGGQQIPRYIFDKKGDGSIGASLAGYLNAPDNMTEQEALISFLQWAYTHCETEHYALILWGHGPELFLQPPPVRQASDSDGDSQGSSHSLYLTPQELRQALEEGIPNGKPKPTIIGFDACSMSMFEVAYEIRGLADFIVASQEEVPDPSFPYSSLVPLFREFGDCPAKLCRRGVYEYVRAYQDYICNASTGMRRVTLSALRLKSCGELQTHLHCLACALCQAQSDPSVPDLVVEARERSRDFAGGLYVDLYDFCANLRRLISPSDFEYSLNAGAGNPKPKHKDFSSLPPWMDHIKTACENVMIALREDDSEDPDYNGDGPLILANSSSNPRNHGLSVYFPYLSDSEYTQLRQPLVKGGPDTIGKGFSVVMNRAASNLLMCVRRQMIVDTEGYYEDLRLSQDTGWYYFIAKHWSRILVERAPEKLDFLYSAQQSAVNAHKTIRPVEDCTECNGGGAKEGTTEGVREEAVRPAAHG